MHSADKEELFRKVLHLAERHIKPYGTEGSARMATLLMVLKRTEWAVSLTSDNTAAKVWDFLQRSGIDMDWVRSMVSEFIFVSDYRRIGPELCDELAESITWLNWASAVPVEYSRLSTPAPAARDVLSKAPWLTFLYLLHISDVIHMLSFKVETR